LYHWKMRRDVNYLIAPQGVLMADVFRWLCVGRSYIYQAAKGKGADERRGHCCLLLTIGDGPGPRNCLVQFEDGVQIVGS
jgi:hypothetical protein